MQKWQVENKTASRLVDVTTPISSNLLAHSVNLYVILISCKKGTKNSKPNFKMLHRISIKKVMG